MMKRGSFDLSFSGIKTQVAQLVANGGERAAVAQPRDEVEEKRHVGGAADRAQRLGLGDEAEDLGRRRAVGEQTHRGLRRERGQLG